MSWQTVIGLEIHVQLKTRTKMFCRCPNGFGAGPNTTTCPICLGHPGTLPVPNRTAVEWTIKLGRAPGLHDRRTRGLPPQELLLSRPVEGLPDLPVRRATLRGRFVRRRRARTATSTWGSSASTSRRTRQRPVHVGGAGGRIVGAGRSLVDYNRGGVPLVEIVTRPDLHSADDVKRFLQLLRQTVVELGVSDAEMEKGTLRCDANVSVREAGEEGYRTRWELKNMNSFTFLGRGIDAAVREQIALHEAEDEVVQVTYDYDAGAGSDTLTPHRSKEEAGRLPLLPRARPRPDRAQLPRCWGARGRRLRRPRASGPSKVRSASRPRGSS